MKLFLPISFWFELLAFIVSIITLRKLKGSPLVYLSVVLCITVVAELYGAYLKFQLHQTNGWLYNLLILVQFPYWMLLFKFYLENGRIKKLCNFLILLFLVYAVANLAFIQGFYFFNNYTLVCGALILIFLCILYLNQLLRNADDTPLLTIPLFWIACGALFFFTGTFFYFSLYSYLVHTRTAANVFNLIILNLNIIFYSCISIGLIVVKKEKEWKRLL